MNLVPDGRRASRCLRSARFWIAMASKLEHALALARQGFKLFPIAPGTKFQPLLATGRARHERRALVAHAVGADRHARREHRHSHDGLVVIDVDVKKGGDESFKLLELHAWTPEHATLHEHADWRSHSIYRLPTGHWRAERRRGASAGARCPKRNGYVVALARQSALALFSWRRSRPLPEAPEWLLPPSSDARQ
jgi:hypothetical protein